MSATWILWTYIALLLAGGMMGFLKAGSKISLGTSAGFAALIALSAAGVLPVNVALVWILLLAVFFGMRFAKGRKFMPAGLMCVLSVGAAAALLLGR